jgi:hypothetical protein
MSIQSTIGNSLLGKQNATAGTVVYTIIPGGSTYRAGVPWNGDGRSQCFTGLVMFQVASASTANSIYVMRAIGRTTTTTTAAANTVAALTLAADPSPSGNTISAGDQVVLEGTDGAFYRNQVNTAGWNSTTLVVTFTANVVPAVTNGSKVYMMGVFTDTDPTTGSAFPLLPTTANTTSDYPKVFSGALFQTSSRQGEPLLLYNPNATDATAINFLQYAYSLQG